MFCSHCGKKTNKKNNFCSFCGKETSKIKISLEIPEKVKIEKISKTKDWDKINKTIVRVIKKTTKVFLMSFCFLVFIYGYNSLIKNQAIKSIYLKNKWSSWQKLHDNNQKEHCTSYFGWGARTHEEWDKLPQTKKETRTHFENKCYKKIEHLNKHSGRYDYLFRTNKCAYEYITRARKYKRKDFGYSNSIRGKNGKTCDPVYIYKKEFQEAFSLKQTNDEYWPKRIMFVFLISILITTAPALIKWFKKHNN